MCLKYSVILLVGASAFACQDPGLAPKPTVAEALSSEIPVDSPLPQPGGNNVAVETIAANDSGFLMVWTEGDQVSNLWAGRFGLDGARLEPVSHSLGVEAPQGASVAFDGTGYVLVWASEEVLHIARLDAAGQMVGAPKEVARLDDDSYSIQAPDVALAGNRLLVVWGVYRGLDSDSVYGQLYDLDMEPVGTTIDIDALTYVQGTKVASDGTDFFVVWLRVASGYIEGAHITADGAVMDKLAISPASHDAAAAPEIAYGAGRYLVIWRISGSAGEREIFGRRYTSAGTLIDTEPLAITAGPGSGVWEQLTFDGTRFVASWIDERDFRHIYAASISPEGVIDPPSGVLVHPGYGAFPTASAAVGGLTLMADGSSYSLMDSSQTAIATTLPMAWQYNTQTAPAMCKTSSGHIVVWKDARTLRGIYAAPVAIDGSATGPEHRLTGAFFEPLVACGDTVHLVVWQDEQEVFALRINDAGEPLDTAPIKVAQDVGGPAVASSGKGFLVVWSDGDIYGRRLGSDGTVEDTEPIPISTEAVQQATPALAFGDGVYFIAWTGDGLRGARVSPNGDVLDPAGIDIATDVSTYHGLVFVAHGDPGFLVGWETTMFRNVKGFVRIVDSSGVPVSPPTPAFRTNTSDASLAAWNGQSFSVLTLAGGILMTAVDASGTVSDPFGFPIASETTGWVRYPTVSSAGEGEITVAYARQVVLGDRLLPRIRLRQVSLEDNGVACSKAAACASGSCVDGVCCDQACGGNDPDDCQACSVAKGARADGQCTVLTPTAVCRPAAGACDLAETCDGAGTQCPSDESKPNGAVCTDADACTTGDACMAGACVSSGTIDCPSPDSCHAGSCDSVSGLCSYPALPDGTTCEPADLCAGSGSCVKGACEPGPPIVCPPPSGPCEIMACDPDVGACEPTPMPNGTPCDTGTCQDGWCMPAPDAGLLDAGLPDAGMLDAGSVDAAPSTDAGPITDGRAEADSSSGGCQIAAAGSESTSPLPAWLAFLVLAIRSLIRRRGGSGARMRQ